ncbi:MAG: hypothetical protein O9293_13905 [Porphyrobacter sp.]|nr:hypothetical protein [Porphyrobacter sp.]
MIRLTHRSRVMTGCMAAAFAVGASSSLSAQAAATAQGDLEAKAPEAQEAPVQTRGEQRLAKLLEGRTGGKPTDCINARPSQKMQTIDGVAYVYGSGNTIYVQRTRDPEQISDTNTLVSNRRTVTQLCRLDVTRTVDRFTGQFTGAVFFEDFVPYTRVSSEGTSGGEG